MTLTTPSTEAQGFYLKQGYEVAATIDRDPPGLTRYSIMKKLSTSAAVLSGRHISRFRQRRAK